MKKAFYALFAAGMTAIASLMPDQAGATVVVTFNGSQEYYVGQTLSFNPFVLTITLASPIYTWTGLYFEASVASVSLFINGSSTSFTAAENPYLANSYSKRDYPGYNTQVQAKAYTNYGEYINFGTISLPPNEVDGALPSDPMVVDNYHLEGSIHGNSFQYGGQNYSDTPYTLVFSETPDAPPPVPEPASWAMFIGGFGLIGASMRRKKVKVSFA